MTKIEDIIKYYHGRDDNRFHEGCEFHDAIVVSIDADEMVDIGILNEAGNPTIPVSNVRRYADPQRQLHSAFWEPIGAKLPTDLWPATIVAADEIDNSAQPSAPWQKGKKK